MGRLIDADKLILSLNDFRLVESPTDTENTEERRISEMVCKIIQHCIEVAEEQPTAYDVEKVVAELESLRIDKINYIGVLNIIAEKYDRANKMLNDAIEIVRNGGVE